MLKLFVTLTLKHYT